jgi:hypothetical protein
MEHLDTAGGIANENILIHARSARSVIDRLNSTAEIVDDFHIPLGIESSRVAVSPIPWREAIRDPEQIKSAGKEVGTKGAVLSVAVLAGLAALNAVKGSKASD